MLVFATATEWPTTSSFLNLFGPNPPTTSNQCPRMAGVCVGCAWVAQAV